MTKKQIQAEKPHIRVEGPDSEGQLKLYAPDGYELMYDLSGHTHANGSTCNESMLKHWSIVEKA